MPLKKIYATRLSTLAVSKELKDKLDRKVKKEKISQSDLRRSILKNYLYPRD